MIDVTRDMLGVPLVTKGRVIGVLEAINKRAGRKLQQAGCGPAKGAGLAGGPLP